jgi:hypothetical protein
MRIQPIHPDHVTATDQASDTLDQGRFGRGDRHNADTPASLAARSPQVWSTLGTMRMKLRARLAAVLAVLSIGAGVAALDVQPAAAATGATVCFKSYWGSIGGANVNLGAVAWIDGTGWVRVGNALTNINGCVFWPLSNGALRNYPFRFKIDHYGTQYVFRGARVISDDNMAVVVPPGNGNYGPLTLLARCYITDWSRWPSPCPLGTGNPW